jgi:hypothetical protein
MLKSIELVDEYIEKTPKGSFLRYNSIIYSKDGNSMTIRRLTSIEPGMRTILNEQKKANKSQ